MKALVSLLTRYVTEMDVWLIHEFRILLLIVFCLSMSICLPDSAQSNNDPLKRHINIYSPSVTELGAMHK